jgi:hypothetical protein
LTSSSRATSSYLLITLAMTWPLLPGLARDVPGDLGDSLLNMWILGWGAEHVPRVLSGQMSLSEFWNANIFHPEPLALSFSEHLFSQVLQILPIYHLTGNLILSYNLLFLSSIFLSALGMYLLVADLLGDTPHARRAAFVAGLVYAFVPMRIAQVAHIQSVSSQWMPLALYGFRRFLVAHGPVWSVTRLKPLAGGTAALLMQNWSCGYYLIFFAPVVVTFIVHQIVSNRLARDWRMWAGLIVASLFVAIGTLPFLVLLYLEGQRVHAIERPFGEVVKFSADVYSYLTAPEALTLWGRWLQTYPKPEGELFFGVVPMALAAVAVVGSAVAIGTIRFETTARRFLAWLVGAFIAVQLVGFIAILLTGGFITSVLGLPVRANNPARLLMGVSLGGVVLLGISSDIRKIALKATRSPLTMAVLLTLFAMWMSLGPLPQVKGQTLPAFGLYGWFYDHVPGFDGLRVPARYAMVAAVFLSIVAGYGAALLLRRVRRPALISNVIAVLFVIEAAFVPMPLNHTWGDGLVMPPARVEPAATAPSVYQALAAMPESRVITEFPFGDPAWELRYVYYSTVHWKRLVNGYSGAFPRGYHVRAARLQRVADNPDEAWQVLRDTGTTHVIVHHDALQPADAQTIEQWLSQRGAALKGRFDNSTLWEIGDRR